MIYDVYFTIFALIAVLCAGGILFARHPIAGALNLVGVMVSLAGIYALQQASFLGVVQILVYAGAIMMLLVFVIMVLNSAKDNAVPRTTWTRLIPGLALGAIFFIVAMMNLGSVTMEENAKAIDGGVKVVAQSMFATSADAAGYYLLFEIIGLVLLVAMVAAILLAKKDLMSPVNDSKAVEGEGHH